MASQPTHAVSAEQLMLSKMQAMQAQVQPPEFIVSANPFCLLYTSDAADD